MALSSRKLALLHDELAAYRGLGMATMAAETQAGAQQLAADVAEDQDALKHLQTDLVALLLRFANSITVSTPGAICSHVCCCVLVDYIDWYV